MHKFATRNLRCGFRILAEWLRQSAQACIQPAFIAIGLVLVYEAFVRGLVDCRNCCFIGIAGGVFIA